MENIYRTESCTDSYYMPDDYFTISAHSFMGAAVETLIACGIDADDAREINGKIVTYWEHGWRWED